MRTLYLGLDPSRYSKKVTHYPIIETVPIQTLDEPTKAAWHFATHILFTSRSAVKHWFALSSIAEQEVFAVGPGTLAALQELNVDATVAPFATQEGMIELLEATDLSKAYLFWPKSASARQVLGDYLKKRKLRFYAFDLYETRTQAPKPLPNLNDFDELVFTSPSTIAAFLQIFGAIPKHKKITCIGPVTEAFYFAESSSFAGLCKGYNGI